MGESRPLREAEPLGLRAVSDYAAGADSGSVRPTRALLGEILVERRAVSAEQVAEALRNARAWNARLGETLVALGWARAVDVQRALADQSGLPFVDMEALPPDPKLSRFEDWEFYVGCSAMPWRRDSDGVVRYACVDAGRAAERLPRDARLAITTLRDLETALARRFRTELVDAATMQLWREDPERSARATLTPSQRNGALVLGLALLAGLVLFPLETALALLAALGLFAAAHGVFRLAVMGAGLAGLSSRRAPRREGVQGGPTRETASASALEAPAAQDGRPLYTILVPLYREPEVLPLLAASLRRLDYPPTRLDIRLVLEEDDEDTIAAARAARLEDIFRIILVPPGGPRTKPKACNYALRFARGEFCVVYDAEDRPEPSQLCEALAVFRAAGSSTVCVQARLNYYNRSENLLTRLFTIEYTQIFDLMLPVFDRWNLPIPLGGTSNHFRTDELRRLGAWDPFNVTEDADLGMRIHARGLRVQTVASTTWEEACSRPAPWLRQRSRWLKGYLQTWLVHVRRPGRMLKALGARGFAAFHLYVGGTVLVALASPVLWIAFVTTLIHLDNNSNDIVADIVAIAGMSVAVAVNVALIVVAALTPLARVKDGFSAPAPEAMALPAYWLAISIAAWRGVLQLVVNPHYWDKTPHGISHQTRAELAELSAAEHSVQHPQNVMIEDRTAVADLRH